MKRFSLIVLFFTIILSSQIFFHKTAYAAGDPGDPSGNGVQPIWVEGNPDCADLTYCTCTLSYKPQPEPPPTGVYTYPSHPAHSIDLTKDGDYYSWTSTLPVCCVIVKGGPNANVYVYDPASYGDTELHAPVNPNNGKLYGLSHIEFCYGEGTPNNPGIDIEKATNGEDADDPSGPEIFVGGTVTWTYEVVNTGNVPLMNVVVTDDNGTPGDPGDDFNPTFKDGDTNNDDILDLDETWRYEATGTATAGQYANWSYVVGIDDEQTEVSEDDPSHYFGKEGLLDPFYVIVDVNPEFHRTWNWEISKEVFPETWDLFKGDQGTSKYTVAVIKTGHTDSGWLVTGTIYIENGGPYIHQIESVELLIDGVPVATACSETLPYEIAVGEIVECTFSETFPDGANRTAVANVLTTSPEGPGLSTGTADIEFGDPTTTSNESINVDDTNGSSWEFNDSGSKTYSKMFTCDEDYGSHENTATIRETQQSDDAQVIVNCYDIEMDKDAETTYNRYYAWNIDKTADKTEITEGCTETTVNYEVMVDKASQQDGDFAVTGSITVYNPAPIAALINSVEDIIPGATGLTVDCGVTFPYTLASQNSITCTYSADLPDASQLTNTAKGKLQNYSYDYELNATPTGEQEYSATADIIFGEPADEIDECIDVNDDNLLPTDLGTVCIADAPKTFQYSKTFGPYTSPTSLSHTNIASFITNDTQTEGQDSWTVRIEAECAGVTITASKTAAAEWERTYKWTIDKSVYPETWDLFKGDEAQSKFTVAVTRSVDTDMVTVSGQVCVTNESSTKPTEGLTIQDTIQYKTPAMSEWAAVTGAIKTITPATQLGPDEEKCYDYTFTFEAIPDAEYRNVAGVTITNYTGHLGEPYGDKPIKTFVLRSIPTTEVLASVNVDDTNGTSWLFKDSGSQTYSKTFTCDADDGSHNNAATIRETRQDASATVEINCHVLEIEKNAQTTYDRYFKWTIDKWGDHKVLDIKACEEAKVMYKVTVDSSMVDKGHAVKGIIEVANPAPIPAIINTLEDILPGAIGLNVDCGVDFPYTLEANSSIQCSYSADLPDSTRRVNTATATLQNHSYAQAPGQPVSKEPIGETPFSNTANVKFGDPTMVVDECVNVYDTNLDPTLLGEVCAEKAPKTFEYTKTFGPYYSSDTHVIDNTAWFVTNDTKTEGKDSWSLTINVKCEPVKADFTADATKGISPFKVQFKDLSINAARWLWEFGDGTTSTEQHPMHTYYNPPRKHYTVTLTVWDCCEEYTDTMTKEYFITSMRPANVGFNAYPIVGPPELEVQFTNNSGGLITHWLWEYGDGMSDEFRSDVRSAVDPMHNYPEEGSYTVSLNGWGLGGSDEVTVSNLIYVDENYLAINLLDGGEVVPGEDWDDAIDHDIISPDASVTAISNDAWATFRFEDTTKTKMIHKLRIMTNNAFGSRFANHLAQDFEVMVSADGVNFTTGFSGAISSKYGWEVFEFDPVEANYLKLVLLNARGAGSPYITLGEFQVFGTDKIDNNKLLAIRAMNDDVQVAQLPEEYALSQNYPNPFNPETRIGYQLPDAADVEISIYNMRGQLVTSLVRDRMEAGYYEAVWSGTDNFGQLVSSGIYIYSFRAINDKGESYRYLKKMTLLK